MKKTEVANKMLYPKKYDAKKGSATWRHKMREAHKESDKGAEDFNKANDKWSK